MVAVFPLDGHGRLGDEGHMTTATRLGAICICGIIIS
jgi:hypothetical protein